MLIKKILLLKLIILFSISNQVFAQSLLFPGAQWEVRQFLGPGVAYSDGESSLIPKFEVGQQVSVRINEHMDQMIMSGDGEEVVFKRVCAANVKLEDIPNIDYTSIDRSLSVWEINNFPGDGRTHMIIFEQPGSGIISGPSVTTSDDLIGKALYSLEPVGDFPKDPRNDDSQDEPIPDVPKEKGINAVARAIATKMGITPDEVKPYLSARADETGALFIIVRMDGYSRALPSERDITDPCDPRYGNIKPATSLYSFRIIEIGDKDGYYYFITTRVIDVISRGITKMQYTPDPEGRTYDLDAEVLNSYDGLNFGIKAPLKE